MPNLRDIRNRINSVKNTQQITKAMKMVAAAKLRRAQENMFATRPYAFKIAEVITHLEAHVDPTTHPLLQQPESVNGVLLVVVTADRGLAGAFNSNIIKKAEQTIRAQYADHHERGTLHLLCVGRKGHEHFSNRGYQLVGDYRGVFNRLKVPEALAIVEEILAGYREERWQEVAVVYNEFKNTISQNHIVEPFLPIPKERFLTPVMAADADEVPTAETASKYGVDYLFEPDAHTLLEKLVPRYLNLQMWRVLLESNAAEQGARMAAMDNATTNAGELLKELSLTYNRVRQAAITKEIIEIASGAEALGQG